MAYSEYSDSELEEENFCLDANDNESNLQREFSSDLNFK